MVGSWKGENAADSVSGGGDATTDGLFIPLRGRVPCVSSVVRVRRVLFFFISLYTYLSTYLSI